MKKLIQVRELIEQVRAEAENINRMRMPSNSRNKESVPSVEKRVSNSKLNLATPEARSTVLPIASCCQLCSKTVQLPQPDDSHLKVAEEASELVKNLGKHLSRDLPLILTEEIKYFCDDCTADLEQMWMWQQQISSLVLKFQDKVIKRKVKRVRRPLPPTFIPFKFSELRDIIAQGYYKRHPNPKTGVGAHRVDPHLNFEAPEETGPICSQASQCPPPPVATNFLAEVDLGYQIPLPLYSTSAKPNPIAVNDEQEQFTPMTNDADAEDESLSNRADDNANLLPKPHSSNGVDILEQIIRNESNFFRCSLCPFRINLPIDSTAAKKEEFRKKLEVHIIVQHEAEPRATKAKPIVRSRKRSRSPSYFCRFCPQTFVYCNSYCAHLKRHPEFEMHLLSRQIPIPLEQPASQHSEMRNVAAASNGMEVVSE